MEGEIDKEQTTSQTPVPSFSSSLYTVIRIKQKYQALKKRRQELSLVLGGSGALMGAPVQSSPKIFTFDGLSSSPKPNAAHVKRKRSRRRRVLYPNRGGPRPPPRQEYSLAKYSLYLLLAIVFMQVHCLKLKFDWSGIIATMIHPVEKAFKQKQLMSLPPIGRRRFFVFI